MSTMENEYTALMAACMAGSLEVVSFLAENGADVNAMNSQGQTPLIHCFSRLTENSDCSPFENKRICFRMAEILFSYGADVNKVSMKRTLLMNFCGISMRMDPATLEINLNVIEFLLQHGADPYQKCESTNKNSYELASTHCAADQVKLLLMQTNQIHVHPVVKEDVLKKETDPIVDTSSISIGCCSIFGCFNKY